MLFKKTSFRSSKLQWGIIIAVCLGFAGNLGCASGRTGEGSTAARPATGDVTSGAPAAQNAGQAAPPPGIKRECRTDIDKVVRYDDGSFGILSSDKVLYRIGADGSANFLRALPDDPKNYSLLPFANIIIHRTGAKIMIEDVETGLELFKLLGDASVDKVWYAQDFEELAIRTAEGRYNIWKTKEKFAGISTGETVQEFLNRQSPDHSLRYPGNLRAMALGKNGNVAVAIDDPESGKVGLIYHLDTVNAPGTLAVQARTNTPVSDIAISPSSNYIAVIDENGDFYFMNTIEKKGFIVFAKRFKNVHGIAFWGNHPVLLQDDRTVVADAQNGTILAEIDGRYDHCFVSGDNLCCTGNGYFDVIAATTGKILQRYAFKGDRHARIDVESNSVTGTLNDDNCE